MIKVGVDIGNSKISCIVCDVKDNKLPEVLSFISIPTLNVSKNTFTNFIKIKNEIRMLIQNASKESQTEIKSINLNMPLFGSKSLFYKSEINIEKELINDLHLKKALNKSEFFNESQNYKILMNYILNYEIDGNIITESPIGNFAESLNLNF